MKQLLRLYFIVTEFTYFFLKLFYICSYHHCKEVHKNFKFHLQDLEKKRKQVLVIILSINDLSQKLVSYTKGLHCLNFLFIYGFLIRSSSLVLIWGKCIFQV